MNSSQLLPAIRGLCSRRPEYFHHEPWELAHVVFSPGLAESVVICKETRRSKRALWGGIRHPIRPVEHKKGCRDLSEQYAKCKEVFTFGGIGSLMTEKGREGLLVWLERAGIVVISEAGDMVSLAPDWLNRLETERELGEEVEMAQIAEQRYKQKRAHYHEYGPVEVMKTEDPPPLMGPEKVEVIVRERAKEDLEARVERQRQKVGITAETFVFDKLRALGQIRLALLMEIYEDAGGDPWDIPPAVRRMGCRVERLPEYENRQFVFAPGEAEGAA